MKKKIYLFLIIFVCIFTIILIYKNKDNKLNGKIVKEEKLSIMIKEEGEEDYTKSSSKEIPKGDYTLNEEKTHCENNGKVINYDSILGSVSFSFIGSDKCYLYFDYVSGPKAYETIFANSILYEDNPEEIDVSFSNPGIYHIEDNFGVSYFFRGAVDNNWLKYGKYTNDLYNCDGELSSSNSSSSCILYASKNDDIYWRILRINGDGTIRLIYSGTNAPTEDTSINIVDENTTIGVSDFNSFSTNESAGYMYTFDKQFGIDEDSQIKLLIDDWYANYTTLNTKGTKVVDQIFCNDRRASENYDDFTEDGIISSWDSNGSYYYFGVGGVNNSFKCNNENDNFSVSTVKYNNKSYGNKALTYPVGLISISELVMTSYRINQTSMDLYLYNGLSNYTMTPNSINLFSCNSDDGMIGCAGDNYVRPVINLSANVKLSGDGTYNNVYTVS